MELRPLLSGTSDSTPTPSDFLQLSLIACVRTMLMVVHLYINNCAGA
jgi:uncharacterized OsmC-like protein